MAPNPIRLLFEGSSTGAKAAAEQTAASLGVVRDSVAKTNADILASAKETVSVEAQKRAAILDTGKAYLSVAAESVKGSQEQVAALRLAQAEFAKVGTTVKAQAAIAKAAADESAAAYTKAYRLIVEEAAAAGKEQVAIAEKTAREERGILAEASKEAGFGRIFGGPGVVAGFAAGAGVAEIIKLTTQAQQAQALLQRALANTGASYAAEKDRINEVLDRTEKLSGFEKNDLTASLTSLVQRTGDVNKALKDMSIVTDLARGAHISLERATTLVVRAEQGNVGMLARLGISIPKVTTNMDALRAAHIKVTAANQEQYNALVRHAQALDKTATATQALDALEQRYAGSSLARSKTLAGEWDTLVNTLRGYAVEIGTAAIPATTKLLGYLNTGVGYAVQFGKAVNTVVGYMGGWKLLIEGVGLAFAAWKIGGIIVDVVNLGKAAVLLSQNFAAIGKTITVAKGEVVGANVAMEASTVATATAMKGALLSTGFGALAIAAGLAAAYILTHWGQVKSWFSGLATFFHNLWQNMWNGLQEGAIKAALAMVEPFTHLPSKLGGWARAAKASLQQDLANIQITGALQHLQQQSAASGMVAGQMYVRAFNGQMVNITKAGAAQVGSSPNATTQATGGTFLGNQGVVGGVVVRGGTAGTTIKGDAYPLGTSGRIIGDPYQGTHGKAFNVAGGSDNWESENAVDIAVDVGTPVIAVEDGTIGSQIGALGSGDPRMAGLRVHLVGVSGVEYYYAHLSRLTVSAGQHVKKGQVIGYSGSANGVAHLHFATSTGSPLTVVHGGAVVPGTVDPAVQAQIDALGKSSKTGSSTETPAQRAAKQLQATITAVKQNLAQLGSDISDAALAPIFAKPVAAMQKYISSVLNAAHPKLADVNQAKQAITNAIRAVAEIKLAQPDLKALKLDLASHILDPQEATKARALIANFQKAVADAMSPNSPGGREITKAELDHITATQKALHAFATSVAADMKAQRDIATAATAALKQTLQGAVQASGLFDQTFSPQQISGLVTRSQKAIATLNSIHVDPATRAKLKADLATWNTDIATGLQQMQTTVDNAKQRFSDAFDAWSNDIQQHFQTDVVGAFSTGLQDAADAFDTKQLQDTIQKQTAALDAAAFNDPKLAQMMRDEIALWKQYYADLAAGNFAAAKQLQGQIIANQDAIDAYIATLPDDQKAQAQAIVDAGGSIIDAVKQLGDKTNAQSQKNWEDLKSQDLADIASVLDNAKQQLLTGKISLPQALADVRSALVAKGMDPAEADKLLSNPLEQGMADALRALGTALSNLTTLLRQIAGALNIKLPDPTAPLASSMETSAGRVRTAINDINTMVRNLKPVVVTGTTVTDVSSSGGYTTTTSRTTFSGSGGGTTSGGGGSSTPAPAPRPTSGGTSGGSTGGGACFVAGTPVLTPDGWRPIEEIRVGDEVRVWSFADGLVSSRVEETFAHEGADARETLLLVADGVSVITTAEHPFWTGTRWAAAGTLKVGDPVYVLRGRDLISTSVSAIVHDPGPRRDVYNLHVEHGDHNYFADGFLVHNVKQALQTGGYFRLPFPGLVASHEPEFVIPERWMPPDLRDAIMRILAARRSPGTGSWLPHAIDQHIAAISAAHNAPTPNLGTSRSEVATAVQTALAAVGQGSDASPRRLQVVVPVHVEGSVQTEQDLAQSIRNALIAYGQQNAGDLFGGYA